VPLDETDRELLRLLHLDARCSAAELARELGVSRATVQNRIDKLKANGTIKRFTIELGQSGMGALIEALALITLASGDSRKIIAQFRKYPEIEAITSANGAYDFVLELNVSSLGRLDEILSEIRRNPMVLETNSIIRLNRFK